MKLQPNTTAWATIAATGAGVAGCAGMSIGHIAKAQAPGFWREPVSYVTDGYKPGEAEAILRNIEAERRRNEKRYGSISEAYWRRLRGDG